MRRLTILFDADDTSENLIPHWVERLNQMYGTNVAPDDVTDWDISRFFPTLTRKQVFQPLHCDDFWRGILPIDGANEYLTRLKQDGHELYMVTASNYKTCKAKVERLLELFPFLDWGHIILASNKQMIRGDVLIDDAPHNLEGGDYFKILMDCPHNKSYNAEANGMMRVSTWAEVYQKVSKIANQNRID